LQVIDLQQKLGIKVSGASPPKPVSSFAHFGFEETLLKAIRKSEFSQPTPIQVRRCSNWCRLYSSSISLSRFIEPNLIEKLPRPQGHVVSPLPLELFGRAIESRNIIE
jgi:hypothetical protein